MPDRMTRSENQRGGSEDPKTTKEKKAVQPSCGKGCVAPPSVSKAEAWKRLLTELFDDYVQKVKRYGSKEDRGWFVDHANVFYPGIGTLALAVPAYFTGKYQPTLDYTGISGVDDLRQRADATRKTLTVNDVKGDHSQRLVGRAFRILNVSLEKEGRPAFVISQTHYDNVLGVLRRPHEVSTHYTKKAKHKGVDKAQLLVPEEVNTKLSQRGENDLMILNKEKGVVFVEIKALGVRKFAEGGDSDSGYEANEADMMQAFGKLKKKLQKDVDIFQTIMGLQFNGSPQGCQTTKVIAVPNMSAALVHKLTAGVSEFQDIRFLCQDHLFTDDVSVPESETDISSFTAWWQAIPQQEQVMDIRTMKEIVGRYVGLLSSAVTFSAGSEMTFFRSVRDNLYHTWRLFRRVVLSPAQVRILEELKDDKADADGDENRMKGRNYLSGAPGSGKTVLLRMRCRTFLAEKASHQAVVVNMYRGAAGRAIGHHIYKEVTTGDCLRGRVHLLNMDVGDLSQQTFTAMVKDCFPQYCDSEVTNELHDQMSSELLFVIDEVHAETFWSDVLVALNKDFPRSRVLCAGIFSGTPAGFVVRPLDIVHRCPPAVQNLLYQVDWSESRKKAYVRDCGHDKTLATNGPQPICVRHQQHGGGPRVTDCHLCGEDLADILLSPHTVGPSHGRDGACATPAGPYQPSRDMKVALLVNMPRSRYHQSGDYVETTREDYDVYMRYVSACPLVATLTARGVHVHLKLDLACPDLHEDALQSPFLTWVYNFEGLEAGVVVYLPGDQGPLDGPSPHHLTALPPANVRSGPRDMGTALRERPHPWPPTNPPDVMSGTQESCSEVSTATRASPREIPTLGLTMTGTATSLEARMQHIGDVTIREEENVDTETSRVRFEPRSPLNHWTSADVQRFSLWDQTNIMVAGSRCLCQLVLIVP